ncbi:hypothetical protein AB0F25_19850 [Streptomyces wedmorensis]|uniref:hypothetical protein n=1 Tax=Streptomyces wedmorensis TaxID=43759 RepID=UPI003413E617
MAGTPKIGDTVGDFRLPGGHLDGDTFHRRDDTLCEQRGKPFSSPLADEGAHGGEVLRAEGRAAGGVVVDQRGSALPQAEYPA